MVSRAKLIVVTIIVALGLIGPMSFIAQEAAKEPPQELVGVDEPTQLPSQPRKFTQTLEYEATVTADIVSVDPQLIVILVSESNETEALLSNLSTASLASVEGEGGVYRTIFGLTDASDYPAVLSELEEINMTVVDQGMPATIRLPDSFSAYRGEFEYTLSPSASDKVEAVISGETQSGPAEFSLRITKSGDKMEILAVEN
ncbi:hypothetical protein ACFLQ2_04070 [archaeon]